MRRPGRGRSRWQPFYRKLHRFALDGLNYGEYEFDRTGEAWALAWVTRTYGEPGVVFDLGANVGAWSLTAHKAWPHARIFAFEPAPDVHSRLAATVTGKRITAVHAAVSDHEGTASLYQVEGISELASLHRRDLAGHGLTVAEGPSVPTITLDEFCADNMVDRIDYLKVDTEGHELAVFNGARRMLEAGRVGVVQFEFGGTHIDSRTYLRDFVRLFEPTHALHRLVRDGLEPLVYNERAEIFDTSTFLALPRG